MSSENESARDPFDFKLSCFGHGDFNFVLNHATLHLNKMIYTYNTIQKFGGDKIIFFNTHQGCTYFIKI